MDLEQARKQGEEAAKQDLHRSDMYMYRPTKARIFILSYALKLILAFGIFAVFSQVVWKRPFWSTPFLSEADGIVVFISLVASFLIVDWLLRYRNQDTKPAKGKPKK
jgi:hypothetical protein